MGLFKKIKKAISKVVKAPLKAVGLAADAPNVQTAAETPVAAPKEVVEDVESSADTESGKKKSRASGKKSLSVSRSSGGGINL
ncbi:hypothetical protein RCIP0016_00038 [Klebsiella phage RCIP0016]